MQEISGPWSEAQRVWIDTKPPIVTCTEANSTLTITEGNVVTLADYFTIDPNGKNTNITKNCTINGTNYTTTEGLAVGTYTVICKAEKTGGLSANTTMTLVVETGWEVGITTATEYQDKTTKYTDEKGNIVWVPEGFKVRTDYATTVQNGIVIEDVEGSQFVWVPVGTITKDDGTKVTIELGRYDFEGMIYGTDTEPKLVQSAANFKEIFDIGTSAYPIYEHYEEEYSTYEEDYFYTTYGIYPSQFIEPWIKNTIEMGGYYLARWEARYQGRGSYTPVLTAQDKAILIPGTRVSFGEPPLLTESLQSVYTGELWVYPEIEHAAEACVATTWDFTDPEWGEFVRSFL